ncbi:hypothetical protein D3C76_1735250 [compost metagenome]
MFSLALVLVERGQVAEAAPWLERARIEGNMNFLRAALVTLQKAGPMLMAFAGRYAEEIERRGE